MKKAIFTIILLFIVGCDRIIQKDENMTISVPTSLELVSTSVVDDRYEELIRISRLTTIGRYSTFIVKPDGSLWSVGLNDLGQLGVGDTTNRSTFTDTGLTGIRSIIASGIKYSSGENFTYIIKDDGTLWSTGRNDEGQLGLGDNQDRSSFTFTGLTGVRDVVSGTNFAYAIKDDSTVYVVGENEYGQLGLGDTVNRNIFTPLNISGIKEVVINRELAFIIKTNNQLWGTGLNGFGQLGVGDTTIKTSFTNSGMTGVSTVITSGNSTAIILGNGDLYTVGYNYYGQLGLGDTTHRSTFTDTGINDAKIMKMEASLAIFINASGGVYSAGHNSNGQLGVGDTSDRSLFTNTGMTDMKDLHIASDSSYLLSNSGLVYSTGLNSYGELGVGDTTNRNSFTNTGESGIKELFAGRYFSIIIDNNNFIKGAGYNGSGGLGLGDITHRSSYTGISEETTLSTLIAPEYTNEDLVIYKEKVYSLIIANSPCKYYDLSYVQETMPTLPFDGKNYTIATGISTMTYTIKGLIKFDTLALGHIKADTIDVTFKNSSGTVIGTPIVDKVIDSSRDESGNLEEWYTTDISYSEEVMEPNSTVEIILYGSDLELGTILLGMSVDAGFTKLLLSNGYIDYSVVETNPFGYDDWVERAKVAVYDGLVDVRISNYDRIDRLMLSLGSRLIILNGSDAKNKSPNGQSIFSSTQKIGRLFNFKQKTKLNGKQLHQMATYSFTLKEIV